jgi:hypothetical protein
MKEKILALLTAAFAGVRKDELNHIANVLAFQVDTEEKAKEVVGKLTADQINSFITDWRKEADAEISKANKTYETGLKQKYDFTEKKQPEVTIPPVTTEDGKIDAAALNKLVDGLYTDTLKCISIHEKWFDLTGCIDAKSKFAGRFESRDSLLYVEHVVPKRFWFIRWGVKERRQEIVSKNPHTRITGAEFVTIRK